ncbi:MAG: hypothetical protein EBQ80_04690 [Proteobacteria bacterium]|nr:hypothetical protein [Pseudomonadota bacterium]
MHRPTPTTNWQHAMWTEALALRNVLPPHGGQILVVAHSVVNAPWPNNVLIDQLCWGEKLSGSYSRILLEGCGNYEWPDVLRQLDDVLLADGKLVVLAPRPWPLGVRGSRWCSGPCLHHWRGWATEAGFEVELATTVAGRWWLLGLGAVRVLVLRRIARARPIVGKQAASALN